MIMCLWRRLLLQLRLLRVHVRMFDDIWIWLMCVIFTLPSTEKKTQKFAARVRKRAVSGDITFPLQHFFERIHVSIDLLRRTCAAWQHQARLYELGRNWCSSSNSISNEAAIVLSGTITICLFGQCKQLISCDWEEVITLKSYQCAVHGR